MWAIKEVTESTLMGMIWSEALKTTNLLFKQDQTEFLSCDIALTITTHYLFSHPGSSCFSKSLCELESLSVCSISVGCPYSLTSGCLWIFRDTNWRTEGKTREKYFLFLSSHSLLVIWVIIAPVSLLKVLFFSCLFLKFTKHFLCSGNFWFSFILVEIVQSEVLVYCYLHGTPQFPLGIHLTSPQLTSMSSVSCANTLSSSG